MHVINYRQRVQQIKKQRPPRKRFWFLLALALAAVFLIVVLRSDTSEAPSPTPEANSQVIPATPAKSGKLKIFSGEQFRDLYNSFAYPNTARINETTPITGNSAADTRIRDIAVKRGYAIRSAPVTNAFQDAGQGFKLQQRAAKPWLDVKAAAAKDGIRLGLTAGYRSAEEQKQLFLEQLTLTGIPLDSIPSGLYDEQISQILRTTAIPGYSRHHTGYTVDISCDNQPRLTFENTICFQWLSANNYEKAKVHGWIPSYPEGTGLQGPDPEAWEYVWVGIDALTE